MLFLIKQSAKEPKKLIVNSSKFCKSNLNNNKHKNACFKMCA